MKRILLIIAGVIVVAIVSSAGYVKMVLPDVGAAPKIDIKTGHSDVDRGRYLAMHVAACMDCHSTRDWTKFSGPMIAGTEGKGGEYFGPEMDFPGKFYSKNLTSTSLGSWTDGEIFRAITTGVDKNGNALFPVMPYLRFGKMARQDVLDIVAYLRTLRPIESNIPKDEIHFPMNFIINTMPERPGFVDVPARSDTVAYGAYLTNVAGCVDCHSPVDKGQIIVGQEFSGGRVFNMPNGVLRSANISPDKETGIGSWTAEAFVDKFKAYETPGAAYPMDREQVNTIMPWTMYAGMDTTDLRAIYAYLRTQKSFHNPVVHFTKKK